MEERVRPYHREIACFVYFLCITIALRVWISLIDQDNLYFEIGVGVFTFIVILVILYRLRRRMRLHHANFFNGVTQLHVHSLSRDVNTGLSPEAFEALPHSVFQSGKLIPRSASGGIYQDCDVECNVCAPTTCSICLSEYINGDIIVSLPCCHVFHRDCLHPWLQMKKLCPLCKTLVRGPTALGDNASVILTNEENSFFIHNNIVYTSTESIIMAISPMTSPDAAATITESSNALEE